MQLFIGGACAGKRDAVTARFPDAVWHRLAPGKRLEECQQALVADTPLVITGVLEWLEAALANAENDALRQQWQGDMTRLCQRAGELKAPLIIIPMTLAGVLCPCNPSSAACATSMAGSLKTPPPRQTRFGTYGMDWCS